MSALRNTALYLAFLWAVAVALFGCSTSASMQVESARRQLASAPVRELLFKYHKGVNHRIEECRQLQLPDAESRSKCMGKYHPDSELSEAVLWVQMHYDTSADSLRELELQLKLIEEYLQ